MSAFHDVRVVRKVYIAATSLGLGAGLVGYGIELWGMPLLPFLGGTLLNALHIFLPRPDVIADASLNPLVRLAAFLCGISGFIAAGLLWLAAANRSVSDIWNQYIRNGHVLVLGQNPFACAASDHLAEAAQNILHVVQDPQESVSRHRQALALDPDTLVRRAGLLRAGTVVVDAGSDTQNLNLAQKLLSRLKAGSTVQSIAIRVADPVLSDQFFDVLAPSGAHPSVSVFDENLILARHALARDPLFKRAEARGQNRVHAVILGFGDLGEKILDQVFLTSVADGLDLPRVTVLDPDAARHKSAFCARRPRVMSNLDISFLDFDPETHSCEGRDLCVEGENLYAAVADAAPTMIYVPSPDTTSVTRTALILRRMQLQFGLLPAPIQYHVPMALDGADFLDGGPVRTDASSGFIPMRLPADRLTDAILGLAHADRLANRIHEAYRAHQSPSEAADVPWAMLADTFKRSNRRTSDHAAAKFWSVGVRLVPNEPLSDADRAKLEALKGAPDTDHTILTLARLEHERWRMDRYLDGWTQGAQRDDMRRIHTMLVPFEELTETMPNEVDKDIIQVRELIDIVLEK